MSETKPRHENAEFIAIAIRDNRYEDPDSDASILARQFLRTKKREADLVRALERIAAMVAGSRGAYGKFRDCQQIARAALEKAKS